MYQRQRLQRYLATVFAKNETTVEVSMSPGTNRVTTVGGELELMEVCTKSYCVSVSCSVCLFTNPSGTPGGVVKAKQ